MTAGGASGTPDGAKPGLGAPGGSRTGDGAGGGPRPDGPASPGPVPLLDFAAVRARLRRLAFGAAAVAVTGTVAEVLAGGAVPGVLGRWLGVFLALVLLGAAVVVALSALAGADRAQRRGERLAGDDVGFLPPRRP